MPASTLLNDPVNIKILGVLLRQPRVSTSELARQVNMSAPAVKERVQRLEEAGIIEEHRIMLGAKALGYAIAVIVRIRPTPGHHQTVAELAAGLPNVVECHRITGDDCFILKAHLRGVHELDQFIDAFLAHGQTTTSIIQSSPVPSRSLPVSLAQ